MLWKNTILKPQYIVLVAINFVGVGPERCLWALYWTKRRATIAKPVRIGRCRRDPSFPGLLSASNSCKHSGTSDLHNSAWLCQFSAKTAQIENSRTDASFWRVRSPSLFCNNSETRFSRNSEGDRAQMIISWKKQTGWHNAHACCCMPPRVRTAAYQDAGQAPSGHTFTKNCWRPPTRPLTHPDWRSFDDSIRKLKETK